MTINMRVINVLLCVCGLAACLLAQKPPAFSFEMWAGRSGSLPIASSGPDAKAAYFGYVDGIALDAAGKVYFAANDAHRVYRLNADGSYVAVAGTGVGGTATDGKQATQSPLSFPSDVAFDAAGNMYIACYSRIYKVTTDGAIRTIAGGGNYGESGEGQLATKAYLNNVRAVVVDTAGNVYFAEADVYKVRKIDAAGILTTIAGTSYGSSGDGGLAKNAQFRDVGDLKLDSAGSMYVVDRSSETIRKITSDGKINKVLGSPVTYTGVGTNTMVFYPHGVALDAQGNFYVTNYVGYTGRWNVIYKCTTAGSCLVIAGTEQVLGKYLGRAGFSGDGGQATSAKIAMASRIIRDAAGNLYFADYKRLRKISASGVITTIAGSTAAPLVGEGQPMSQLTLLSPRGLAVDSNNNVYVADDMGHRVWKITQAGTVTAFAGTGTPGFSGDGGQANQAELSEPTEVSVDTNGNVYITDWGNDRFRKVTTDGRITTAAGRDWDSCTVGAQDGLAATTACFNVYGAAADSSGNLYLATGYPYQVTPAGIVKSLQSKFSSTAIYSIATDKQGNVYALQDWNKLMKMTPGGTVTTVAGTGVDGHTGDGGAATAAQIEAQHLAVGPDGAVYLGEYNQRSIRHIATDGIIRSIAGNKDGEFPPDSYGLPALNAFVNVEGLAADANGNVYISPDDILEDTTPIQRLEPGTVCRKCVTNAASYRGGVVAPNEILTIFGMDTFGPPSLSTYQLVDGGKRFADVVANTKVLFDDVKSPIIYVGPNQASVVAPHSIAGKQTTKMVIDYNGKRSNTVTLDVLPAVPGIFTIDQSGKNQGAVLNWPTYAVNGTANKIAKGGVVMIFATSGGDQGEDGVLVEGAPSHPLPVSVWIDNKSAKVIYAGAAPGLISGMLQINVEVPASARSGDAIPVYIKVGNEASNATFAWNESVTIAIQ